MMSPDNEPSHITFENEEQLRPAQSSNNKASGIAQWVMKNSGGSIKNETQANYVLIALIVLCAVTTLFLMLSGGKSKAKFVAPPGQQIVYPENAPPRLQEIP
jgi:hypothetical protein